MILLNFSHPLTAEHRAQVERESGQKVERVVDIPVQIRPDRPLLKQIVELADKAELSPEEWPNQPLVVNLPGYALATAALLAELHGRMGHFPTVLWILPAAETIPRRFEVAGLIDLAAWREEVRKERR